MDEALADVDYADLTTIGRRTGSPRTVEIWFAARGSTVYLLSGGGDGAHWVRNLMAEPRVTLRIRGRPMAGRGRIVSDPAEDELARDALVAKYRPRYGGDLSEWRASSLPVAIDLEPDGPSQPGEDA